jgi:hypothetical protein
LKRREHHLTHTPLGDVSTYDLERPFKKAVIKARAYTELGTINDTVSRAPGDKGEGAKRNTVKILHPAHCTLERNTNPRTGRRRSVHSYSAP